MVFIQSILMCWLKIDTLQSLFLNAIKNHEDLSFINQLSQIKELDLLYLPKHEKFPDLGNCKKLERLRIWQYKRLTDIEALTLIPNLEEFEIADTASSGRFGIFNKLLTYNIFQESFGGAKKNMEKKNMAEQLDNYYLNKTEPNKSYLLALRNIILNQDTNITETKKWGMPCFCYKKKMFCYLWTDKKTDKPYLLMVEGKYLDHPQLEQGDRTRMKVYRVDPNEDLPITTILSILQNALELYRTGTIKIK